MSRSQAAKKFDAAFVLRKFSVSAFIVFTFVAYAIHERGINPDGSAPVTTPLRTSPNSPAAAQQPNPVPTNPVPIVNPTAILPTDVPAVPVVANGQYKDGQYTGTSANAYYGEVQVKAIIQGGKITDVQFLSWPSDRRTSQRINAQAMPYLTTEAVQAQSAQVDIISGATLTSEAFIASLQSSLDSAKG